MKNKYKHIFFDLDHTLWDYDANANETLIDIYEKYSFKKMGFFSVEEFLTAFHQENEILWTQYNQGIIPKSAIRQQRFVKVFEAVGLPLLYQPPNINQEFVQQCPFHTHVIDHTFEILDYLFPQYEMHIITNGFDDIQHIKLAQSGLDKYFGHVITSESCGARKPSEKIFQHALALSNSDVERSIMIGDNAQTDILGAREVGMDHIFFNPHKKSLPDFETIEIKSLLEIKDIL